MKKTFYLPYAILCTLLLSACLHDDDDDDGDGDPYTGNSQPSSINASTAGHWAAMGMGGAQSTGSFIPLSAGNANALASMELVLARHAASLSTSRKTASSGGDTDRASIQEAVNENETCENGGTAKITGNTELNGNQELTITYSNCEMAGVLTDGVVTVNMTNVSSDGLSFNATFDYRDFSISGDDFSFIQDGEVTLSTSFSNGLDQTLVLNLVLEDEIDGLLLKFVNFTSRTWTDPASTPTGRFSVSGRIYDSVLGYVDFTTEAVFQTSSPAEMPPDFSGTLRITGSNGSHALVEVGHDSTGSFFTIKVDSDNNGVYEINAVIPHELLEDDLTEDLADTDGDGMHNSWETFYTLNPADPADATGDADGDGADNLLEYNSGYDPQDAGSTPPP